MEAIYTPNIWGSVLLTWRYNPEKIMPFTLAHSLVGHLHCWVIMLKLARSQNCTGLLNEESSQYKASLRTVVTNLYGKLSM